MTFENIQLPAAMVADLYKHHLVLADNDTVGGKKPEPVALPNLTAPAKNGVVPAARHAEEKQPTVVITDIGTPKKMEQTGAAAPPAQPVIQYLGGNKKEISIVIEDADAKDIAPADLQFLQKMMAACKLSTDDLAIINMARNGEVAKELWQRMPCKVMLLFGVQMSDAGLPFSMPHFQVQQWSNATFMAAPPLRDFIGPDTPELKALKRELWDGLQRVFLGK